ncbi:hypothetical protein CEK26_010628 [Fusarium fujikuroi]|nr:hypothetical protein CEK27_010640 [Fusarium fujikuroi]QGI83908.1 hypothetical protein CEK25_010637 [Fusarium fujikuroi]QGI97559.1 hypothetical protein CEK26_010628 [Fusarium fujikuroi]SCV48331.1 uncharacterized protein FFFS_08525 [Fusarium fujikuroi]
MPQINKNNGQDRRSRRHDPLGRAPERTAKREESPQQGMKSLSVAQRVSRPSETRSSTPRGGRPGQRGRGGYPNVGVRGGHGGHSSSRPSSSMYWNQPQPESETMYKYSAMAWMTRVCTADGVPATKLTPSGPADGFGNNWYTDTADNGLWIRSETGLGLDNMAKRLKEDNPTAVGFNITMSAIIPDKFEAIERDHTQKVVMNNDFGDKDGKPVGLFGRNIQAPSEKKHVVKGWCKLCGSKSHTLTDCVMRGYKGHVTGCPICNDQKHAVDSCEQFRAMSLQEKVKILVQQRANMPPLKTSKPWHTYLYEFCTREKFVPGVVFGFPWSQKFCRDIGYKGMEKIQAAFDAYPEWYVFAIDPKTASYGKVFETYWQPAGMVWPAILGPRT